MELVTLSSTSSSSVTLKCPNPSRLPRRSLASVVKFTSKTPPEHDPIDLPVNVRRPLTPSPRPSPLTVSTTTSDHILLSQNVASPNLTTTTAATVLHTNRQLQQEDDLYATKTTNKTPPNPLRSKLWLSTNLSPPPPPPSPSLPTPVRDEALDKGVSSSHRHTTVETDFRQKGKIFVGNLPLWIKKNEIAEYFRQFGPVKNVVLIKGHDDPERNVGYAFVIYGGPTAGESAEKAVEFDGVEFHGKVLTVRMDDGRRLKVRSHERSKWVAGEGGLEHRSKWHEERDTACQRFRKILDTQPTNWQAVVSSFQKIAKVIAISFFFFLFSFLTFPPNTATPVLVLGN